MSRFIAEEPDRFEMMSIAALCFVWLFMALAVNPIGNFPLNDDWSYGSAVRSLVDEGTFRLPGWVSMPLIVQILWGSLFCLPFGFSFTALRLSTLTMGLVGVLATYALLREARANRYACLLGALLVACNPLYFELSNTFMTDVPFLALATLSFVFFMRALRQGNHVNILTGALLSCMATLIRQLGVVIPVSFAIAYLIKNKPGMKAVVVAVLPAFLTGFALIAYQALLQSTIGLPALYHSRSADMADRLTTGVIEVVSFFGLQLGESLAYLGLFLFPLLILRVRDLWQSASPRKRLPVLIASSGVVIAILPVLTWQGHLMPFAGNIWFDMGLGPVRLPDVTTLKLPHFPVGPGILLFCITLVSLTGAVMLVLHFFRFSSFLIDKRLRNEPVEERSVAAFLSCACVLYLIPICVAGLFDIYLLFLLPPVMAIIACPAGRTGLPHGRLPGFLSSVLLLAYFTFALGATHDYLAWNRARWQALHYLTNEAGISHEKIDGGFEFNGLYGYDPHYRTVQGADGRSKSWWWVRDDEYMIALGPIAGYEEIKCYTYKRWIPYRTGNVFILHRRYKS